MMAMDEIRAALADRNLREVSRRSGVSYAVIYSAAKQPGYNMRVRDATLLSDYLAGR